jgi:hypothetical protein
MVGVQVGTEVPRGVAGGKSVGVRVKVGKGVRVAGAWAKTRRKAPGDWIDSTHTSPPRTTIFTRAKSEMSTVHCWLVMVASSFLSPVMVRPRLTDLTVF